MVSGCGGRSGQLAHVGDDCVGRERGDGGAVLLARRMASPGEGHHPHAGGLRRLDARRAVLDHQAGGGSIAQGRGGVKKRSGAGLPWATIVAEKARPAKRGQSPVTVSDSSIRSGCEEEATQ